MELKRYQQEVINDLEKFLERIDDENRLDTAYHNFWESKGVNVATITGDILRPYDNSVKGVPRVTVKVPTAGGKTFIACNALRPIFESLPSHMPKVVAWFVPSDTILKQTYKNLSNPNHPYRQKINSHFGGAVRVIDKESALFGQGISPSEVKEQLTIFVLSVQSFAANNKSGRLVYRENENLAQYAAMYDSLTHKVEGSDETGLIQVLSYLKPVIIIDESHNFEADLRVEMLNSLNPSFILDLTATPRKKSNIISFVDAIKLKKENMVKLPVVVYNHKSSDDVLSSAIALQRSLEQKAIAQEEAGGKYIRPIVLFQAQPKTDSDNITFDKIKAQLVEIGIPEAQIKIKTAAKDEIKGLDLMRRDCEVRYIITVNALKEGWDCPFAYILASLANKSSRVDVEQILGRVLRLPYTTKHTEDLINLSYVFTSSSNFRDTLDNIIASLNRAGFSKKDYRIADKVFSCDAEPTLATEDETKELFASTQAEQSAHEEVELNISKIKTSIENAERTTTAAIEEVALSMSNKYEEEVKEAEQQNSDIPNDIKEGVKNYTIKDIFAEEAAKVQLPVFVRKVSQSSLFEEAESFIPLTKSDLSEGFDLSQEDRKISFTRTEIEAVRVDLEQSSAEEYAPTHRTLKPKQLALIREHFATVPTEQQREILASKIARGIKINEIAEPQITRYIKLIIESFDNEALADLLVYETHTTQVIKNKIGELLTEHRKKKFEEWLDTGMIKCGNSVSLPTNIVLPKISNGISKGLYTAEGSMNDFEYRVINAIANLDNVLFWHRNGERNRGFCISGHINHYPDFIVRLRSGLTIIIETKGDDRDNSDSRHKLDLGRAWANKAGENYRYFMVFDNTSMEGAYTSSQIIDMIGKM